MERGATLIFPTPSCRELSAKLNWQSSLSTLLGGSVIMLCGSMLIAGSNFLYNVQMARMLGPAEFGHASVLVTIFMLLSAIALSFQLVCAKFVAKNETWTAKALVYHQLMKRAALVGLLIVVGLIGFSSVITNFLHLPDRKLLIVLAMGMAFYPALGVRRGNLQGSCAFPKLSANLVIESVLKLLMAVTLVQIGYGVLGAVAAIALSVIFALMLAGRTPQEGRDECKYIRASFREGIQAIVFFVGQVVISNTDVLVVKHFFPAEDAGLFAAVALVGRLIFYASWSFISAMFPVSAAAPPQHENKAKVLAVPLAGVAVLSLLFIVGLRLFPGAVVQMFGAAFNQAPPLLALYATGTGIYSLSVVLMAYEMSRRIANTGWLQLAMSALLVLGITLFHANLRQVIHVQIVLMTILLLAVSIPFLRTGRLSSSQMQEAA